MPTALEKDTNAAIKKILSEMEIAARTPPVDACHPYAQDARRRVVIRTMWDLHKRLTGEVVDGDAGAAERTKY